MYTLRGWPGVSSGEQVYNRVVKGEETGGKAYQSMVGGYRV